MPITSTGGTATIDGSTATFDLSSLKGAARGEGIIAYINYTLGGTDDIEIQSSFKNSESDDTNFYDEILVVSNVISLAVIGMPVTGKYRIPISVASNEEEVKLTFSGLDTGTINIEFAIDNGYT